MVLFQKRGSDYHLLSNHLYKHNTTDNRRQTLLSTLLLECICAASMTKARSDFIKISKRPESYF